MKTHYPCFKGREALECLGCPTAETCHAKDISTTGDLHIGCPKKGTWQQDPRSILVDICDGCGEERA